MESNLLYVKTQRLMIFSLQILKKNSSFPNPHNHYKPIDSTEKNPAPHFYIKKGKKLIRQKNRQQKTVFFCLLKN